MRTYDSRSLLQIIYVAYIARPYHSQNRDLKYNRIVSTHLVYVGILQDPYSHFLKLKFTHNNEM